MSHNLSWKTRISLFIFSTAVATSCRKNYTVNRRLWSFFDIKVPRAETPRINGDIKSSDITIDNTRNLWLRLYTPATVAAGESHLPIIIYMHGGGFSFFEADSIACDMCCERLVRELNVVVASINYRLAPEHKCPCQYDDCFDVVKFIDANWDIFPTYADPKRCFLLGDSAGGNLIHHVSVKTSVYDEFKRLEIVGLVSIQPFFGGEERTESEVKMVGSPVLNLKLTDWFWKAFLPDGSDRDHPATNVFGPKSIDISGLKFPCTLLVIGGLDILQDWQRRYYQGMKKFGKEVRLVEYPKAIHGFWGLPECPEYSLFIKDLKDFIKSQSTV